ncbi:MAG: hypothetical protein IJ361_07575 [Spirochaetaceae bacterium]|nr:hypothetical protein [Spirochaetaceae bacterium]
MKNLKSIYLSASLSFKINLFKSMFAFLLASFLTGMANVLCSFIMILTSKTLILPFCSMFVLLVVNTALTFGLQLLIYLLYKRENAILGHLFYFFKDIKRIFIITLFQLASYFVLIFLAFIPYFFLGNANQDFNFIQTLLNLSLLEPNSPELILAEEVLAKGISSWFFISTLLSVILILFFTVITSFIPFKLFENSEKSVLKIIVESVKLSTSSLIKFLYVCFMSIRWILLVFVLCLVAVFILKINFITTMLSFVLGLLMICFYFGCSAFYCYKVGFVFSSKNEEEVLSLPESEFQIIEEDENPSKKLEDE